MGKTTIVNIDLAGNVKDDINFNSDVRVPNNDLRIKIMSTPNNHLMRIVNTINSPKTIIDADVIDNDFLNKTLLKEE